MQDRPHILIVEDDPWYAEGLQEILEPPFCVSIVHTLAAATEILRTVEPDLILLDLGLPDSPERHETAGRVAEVTLAPIVAMSSCGDAEAVWLGPQILAAGAVGFLRKGGPNGAGWGTAQGRAALVGLLQGWIGQRQGDDAGTGGEPMRILIVEDDEQTVTTLRSAVNEAVPGAYCDCVGSIGRAVQQLTGLKYRLVILDLNIEGSRGLNTLDVIAQHIDLAHILVVTGQTDLEDDIRARSVPYIGKPFLRADMIRAIRIGIESRIPAVSLLGLLHAASARFDRAANQGAFP